MLLWHSFLLPSLHTVIAVPFVATVQFLISTWDLFSYLDTRYIPLKKQKSKKKQNQTQSVVSCAFFSCSGRWMSEPCRVFSVTCLTSCCSVRLQPFSALQPLNLSPHVSCSKSRNHRENWVSLAVVVAQINWACNVKSARGSSSSSVQSRVNFIKHGACDRQHSLQHRNAGLLCVNHVLHYLFYLMFLSNRAEALRWRLSMFLFPWWSVLQAVTTAVQAEWLRNYQ